MKFCRHCGTTISGEGSPGRQEQCSVCGADLHSCRNCTFYDDVAYNNCREPQAERVLDKTRANFCEFFRSQSKTRPATSKTPIVKDKLESLFKKPA